MNIKLISNDPELLSLCRGILRDMPEQDWSISAAEPDTMPGSDVCIWDCHTDSHLPTDIGKDDLSRYLFLVHRNELPRFREHIPAIEAKVLLKPVTRATLEVFLSQAIAAASDREFQTLFLKAECDDMLQCLIETNLRLQEYDQDRTTFLAKAVHDFRTPLTAVSGYCGLLMNEALGPLSESQKEIVLRMQNSAKRLSRLANSMLQLSAGRYAKRRPELRRGDIRECLDQALHEIAPFADDKRLAIRADLSSSDIPLYFEAGQIEQLLINILDNACKFTPKGGVIEIRGYPFFWERRAARPAIVSGTDRRRGRSTEPNGYRVDIQDSGSAIPDEYLHRIFEEYTSYGGGRDRSGGGLGLAIARMILNQHEGCVWAENTEAGPRFSFILPIYRREPAHAEAQIENSLNTGGRIRCRIPGMAALSS